MAIGAARYASYRFATDPKFTERHAVRRPTIKVAMSSIATTTLPHGLNVLVTGENGRQYLDPMVRRGSPLPSTEHRVYEVASAGYGLQVSLFEGEPEGFDPSWPAQYTVDLPRELLAREGDPVSVHVSIGQSGRVELVRAVHVPTGTSRDLVLKNPDRVHDEATALEVRRRRLAEVEVI